MTLFYHRNGFLFRIWLLIGQVVFWFTIMALIGIVPVESRAQATSCPNVPGGELIINQNFGLGNNKPSLKGLTTYEEAGGNCPENGGYKLVSAVDNSCFTGSWHVIASDHTEGVVGGNMLLVNASDEPGVFYQQPVPTICPGTSYEFSVWAINILKPTACSFPALPDLSISVETESGKILQTINIGTIPLSDSPAWQRFSATFTAPEIEEVVVVKLINRAGSGGCGNDMALDDIQLKPCAVCPSTPLYVPDAFTPNNDDKNQKLGVYLRGAVSFQMTVFDRWGTPVFSSDSPVNQWDGTYMGVPCPAGTYVWQITWQSTESVSLTIQQYTRRGRVILLR